MWAMMVHALGALSISALGGLCMKRRQRSFIETWIQRFIERNPRLFRDLTGKSVPVQGLAITMEVL